MKNYSLHQQYLIYLQDCQEWGGKPKTEEEFIDEIMEEREIKQ